MLYWRTTFVTVIAHVEQAGEFWLVAPGPALPKHSEGVERGSKWALDEAEQNRQRVQIRKTRDSQEVVLELRMGRELVRRRTRSAPVWR